MCSAVSVVLLLPLTSGCSKLCQVVSVFLVITVVQLPSVLELFSLLIMLFSCLGMLLKVICVVSVAGAVLLYVFWI